MTSHFTRFLQRFYCSQQIYLDPSSDITTDSELGDLRTFSLNSLVAFLAILVTPKALQPAVLTVLVYTNSLRLSNTCFFYNHLTLSRVLHVMPLLVVSCMAYVQLVCVVQSPVLAVVAFFLGALPLVTMAIRFGGQLGRIVTEASAPILPVQMHCVVVPAALSSAESGEANGN